MQLVRSAGEHLGRDAPRVRSPTSQFRPSASRVTAPLHVSAKERRRQAYIEWESPAEGEPLKYVVSIAIDGRPFRVAGSTASRSIVLPARGRDVMHPQVAVSNTRCRGPRRPTFTLAR